ncbi:MAG: glucose 1-dehydrogenase [Sphingomonadaceae bacterium]|nr:glucose 1-dehydrogenase [Sphingomonadaceae bacterium]
MRRLAEKIALVTGGGRGIGAAVAKRLAQDGARVIINFSRSAQKAEEVAATIRHNGGDASIIEADISNISDIDRMSRQVEDLAGHLDILVNNAGHGTAGRHGQLSDISIEDFDRIFALNTRGLFFSTQSLLPLIRDGGRIINFSSSTALCRVPGLSAYGGSKAAVEAFSRVWAVELAHRHITVNTVQPGMVNTDMITGGMGIDAMRAAARAHPAKRVGEPEDLADIVAFLASDDSRWINGQVISATGGTMV